MFVQRDDKLFCLVSIPDVLALELRKNDISLADIVKEFADVHLFMAPVGGGWAILTRDGKEGRGAGGPLLAGRFHMDPRRTVTNRTYSATYGTGLIGALAGESLGKAVDRSLEEAQRDGPRLVFMVRDGWSIWRWLGAFIGFVLSLGLWGRLPGYLLITEASSQAPAQATAPAAPTATAEPATAQQLVAAAAQPGQPAQSGKKLSAREQQ